MVVLIAAMESVPQLLVEAARVDGARRVCVLWHVTLLSIRPGMRFVMLIWSLRALQIFTQSRRGAPDCSGRSSLGQACRDVVFP